MMLFASVKITGLQDDVVFPEPEELCKRILQFHELYNHRGWYLSLLNPSADWPDITAHRYCTNSQEE